MSDGIRKQSFLLPLGVAFAVTASLPLASVVADAATAPEKLSALRAAANSGDLALRLDSGGPAADGLTLAGFDNSTSYPNPDAPDPGTPAPDPGTPEPEPK